MFFNWDWRDGKEEMNWVPQVRLGEMTRAHVMEGGYKIDWQGVLNVFPTDILYPLTEPISISLSTSDSFLLLHTLDYTSLTISIQNIDITEQCIFEKDPGISAFFEKLEVKDKFDTIKWLIQESQFGYFQYAQLAVNVSDIKGTLQIYKGQLLLRQVQKEQKESKNNEMQYTVLDYLKEGNFEFYYDLDISKKNSSLNSIFVNHTISEASPNLAEEATEVELSQSK